ncbi:MAG: hypothetical protein JWO82_2192 [Akkermansiaceae bacterium]|nr:hypothetical protein [Akkermansiaceae bacterium]
MVQQIDEAEGDRHDDAGRAEGPPLPGLSRQAGGQCGRQLRVEPGSGPHGADPGDPAGDAEVGQRGQRQGDGDDQPEERQDKAGKRLRYAGAVLLAGGGPGIPEQPSHGDDGQGGRGFPDIAEMGALPGGERAEFGSCGRQFHGGRVRKYGATSGSGGVGRHDGCRAREKGATIYHIAPHAANGKARRDGEFTGRGPEAREAQGKPPLSAGAAGYGGPMFTGLAWWRDMRQSVGETFLQSRQS